MAGLTGIACRNMPITLTAGGGAIVTTETSINDTTMIHRGTHPLVGVMAGIALLVSRYRHVIVTQPCRRGSIMTTCTRSDHLLMIHGVGRNRRPSSRRFRVTGLTDVLRINMRITLAAGDAVVVIADAIGGNAGVVYAGA